MASNDNHVVPAGGDERRFFVLDVSERKQKDTDYFGAMVEEQQKGGREALLHHLLTYPLGKFEVRNAPTTDALQEQKLLSLSVEEEWWYQKLYEGRLLPEHLDWHVETMKTQMMDDFVENAKRFNVTRRGSATALGQFLHRVLKGNLKSIQRMASIEKISVEGHPYPQRLRAYFYGFPTLKECRELWSEQFGRVLWPEVEEEF